MLHLGPSNALRMCAGVQAPVYASHVRLFLGSSRRQLSVLAANKKGFGNEPQKTSSKEEKAPAKKMKNRRLQPVLTVRPQADNPNSQFMQVQALEESGVQQAEEDDFAKRLDLLKAKAEEIKATMPAGSVPGSNASPLTGPPAAAAFDITPDMYANPQPLMKTLTGSDQTISDPKLRDANIGPSQVGLGISAIVLVAVFVVVSGGDYAGSRRYKGVQPAAAPPDAYEEKLLRGQIAVYETRSKANPKDTEAIEALAVTYAKLFEFEKAADLLERLTKREPSNLEAWRLLGETSLLSQQSKRAVQAYEKVVELRTAGTASSSGSGPVSGDLQVYSGLVDAYIANGEYNKAAGFLTDVRGKALTPAAAKAAAEAAASSYASSTSSLAASTSSAAAALPGTASLQAPDLTSPPSSSSDSSDATSSASSSAPSRSSTTAASTTFSTRSSATPIDTTGVDLLLGKVYAAWRGHDNDALAVYERAIETSPEDFRPYLAKGLFLKERGRKADAERMFLQVMSNVMHAWWQPAQSIDHASEGCTDVVASCVGMGNDLVLHALT